MGLFETMTMLSLLSLSTYQSRGDGSCVHRRDDAINNNVTVHGVGVEQTRIAHDRHIDNSALWRTMTS